MKTKHSFLGRYFPLLIIFSAIISACDSSTLSGDDPSGGPGGSQGTGWNKDQPYNAIFYKTNTGSIISIAPDSIIAYGANEEKANIISNTYSEEGIGKIVFDKDLRAIASEAFCRKELTSISIPSGVTRIESGTFEECSSLTSINIPSGVTTIGRFAFYGCTSLTSISIPSGVTTIGEYVFYGCTSLATVTVLAPNPPRGNYVHTFEKTSCIIYVPSESVDAYKSAWPTWADRIQPIQ